MPELNIYHLDKPGAFHFGTRGVEQEETGVHLPADSLFAAIVAAWLEQGADPGKLTDLFPRREADNAGKEQIFNAATPPFLLTSLFPRAGNLRFYPALPLGWMLSPEKLDSLGRAHRLKEVKKIKFISETLFKTTLGGQWLDDWIPAGKEPSAADRGLYLQGGALWLDRAEIATLPPAMRQKPKQGDHLKALREASVWKVGKTPRVAVDRISNASNIFHTGRLLHGKGCGFWFGVKWQTNDDQIRSGLERALALLADSGLGAERNAGYGHFTLTAAGAIALPTPEKGDFFVTLSRYNPRKEDLPAIFADDRAAYSLVSVAGWLKSPVEAAQRRRRVWLFQEGSVLQHQHNLTPGALVDARPIYQTEGKPFPHPVWRYGLAFPVKIQPAGGVK